jgi:hypothetical protein
MSEFGASLLLRRKDKKPISKSEAKLIEKEMKAIAKKLKLKNTDGAAAPVHLPWDPDADGALFVVTSSWMYKDMPDEIAEDSFKDDKATAKKLVKPLETIFKGVYTYEVGTSEW